MAGGRPTDYNEDLADAICEAVATGGNIHTLANLKEFPHASTIYRWLYKYPEFSENYARARETRADVRSDKIDDICNQVQNGELDPSAARVIIDAIKWQSGKEKSKYYGDRQKHEHTGADGAPLAPPTIVVKGVEPEDDGAED